MPLWTIQHSVPLSAAQQDALAQVITTAHGRRFGVPRVFVNVSYQDISSSVEYIGGKRVHPNRIIAAIRPNATGAGRSDEAIEALLQEVLQGWEKHVGTEGAQSLGAIIAETSLQGSCPNMRYIYTTGPDCELKSSSRKASSFPR